jgi:hypothetical protein
MAISYDPKPLLVAAGVGDLLTAVEEKGYKVTIQPLKHNGKIVDLLIKISKGENFSSQTMPCSGLSPISWGKADLVWLAEIFTDLVNATELGNIQVAKMGPKSGSTNTKKVVSSDRVKLEDATALYQPVFGTDPTSKYFVVGIADGLKIAARVQNSNVSIKVVGPRIKDLTKKLTDLGFSGKEAGHWSAHITCSHTTPEKLIGAVLLGLGVPFETGIPQVSVIEGK